MMKMPFWFIYLIFIYIFFYKIKKWTKKLTSLQGFKKEKEKAIEQTGTTVLASYIYVHDKFIHLNFFKTHSTKWKKKKKSLTKKKKTHSTIPSISIQWCSVGGQGMKGGLRNKSITHWKADWVCIVLGNDSHRLSGQAQLPWNVVLIYGTRFCTNWRMKTVPGTKQQTVNNPCPPPVCTNMHAVTWHTHFSLTVRASEFAYMSLYIIYLYLVKNKLHNSTNSEKYFFKLKMS